MAEMCKRPGCSGTIVDGICEDCGRPPLGGPSLVATSGAALAAPNLGGSAAVTGASRSSLTGRSMGSSRRSTRSSQHSSRRALGGGLIELKPIVSMDPMLALMADPTVPVAKRFCPGCDAKLNLEKGFCPQCGAEYSFIPGLKAGDIVAGQYEIKGPLAFGGLGWIYLGWDKALSRWIVIKGLLNAKDAAAAAAATAEKQFLAAVKHPKIVGVYNFVTQGSESYIVMEYVGGKTLKTIRKERGPLPVTEAIAYIHGILPAFGYLARMNLVYCDFKPDNFMLEEDDVKLIDMGGVRRVDDMGGDVYGTKGYSAPEAGENPSFVSDLYTVARTLAVLLMDFKFQGQYEFTIPPPQEQPIFAQHESLYRWLLKATHQDPDERFQTAEEMGEQLLGVLREIAAETDAPKPFESTLFLGDPGETATADDPLSYRLLPALKMDTTDPAANTIMAASVVADLNQRVAMLDRAANQFKESYEAPLRLASTRIRKADYANADKALAQVQARDPFEWRVLWYRGLSLLAQHRGPEARATFDRIYTELPGELPPKLGLAMACELVGDLATAVRLYDVVSRTDPAFTTASFGLARSLEKRGDRAGAVAAYARVASTSNRHIEAQMAACRALVKAETAPPGEKELLQAGAVLEALALDTYELHSLATDLLSAAVCQIEARAIQANGANQILGHPMETRSLRFGLERELRMCAHLAKTEDEKIALVDRANQERPRTLV